MGCASDTTVINNVLLQQCVKDGLGAVYIDQEVVSSFTSDMEVYEIYRTGAAILQSTHRCFSY